MQRIEKAFLCIIHGLSSIRKTILKPLYVVLYLLQLLAVKALYFPIQIFLIILPYISVIFLSK